MEHLPLEIIEKILIHPDCSIKDVVNVSVTCKRLQHIITDCNTIWKQKYIQRFPFPYNKIEDPITSYYQEVKHALGLQKYTRILLETMPQRYHKKVELPYSDLAPWEAIVQERWDNYHYLVDYLLDILDEVTAINTMDIVPLNTTGNLTRMYYATKVLRYIRQLCLSKLWKKYVELPPEYKLMEIGGVVIAHWCQPLCEIDYEEVYDNIDLHAIGVKDVLKRKYPDHPLFKATKEQLDLWRFEMRPKSEWNPSDSLKIIEAIKVRFLDIGLMGTSYFEPPFNVKEDEDLFINKLIFRKKGLASSLVLLFEAIGRRLGLKLEPVLLNTHCVLMYCAGPDLTDVWYYIDPYHKCKIYRRGSYSDVLDTAEKYPAATPEQLLSRIATDLEVIAKENYSPSGRDTKMRSRLELSQLLNPESVESLIKLIELYMQFNFDLSYLECHLSRRQFDNPNHVRRLTRMFRHYRAVIPDAIIRPARRNNTVMFAVGMVMRHLLFGYRCVIFNWDTTCLASYDWRFRNNVDGLMYKSDQPFYNVLVEDGSYRYAAQENLNPIHTKLPIHLSDDVGRYFSHWYRTHYVPNLQTETEYIEDRAVRRHYHELLIKSPPSEL